MRFEIEVTLRCNAACPQCSRHSPALDYGNSDITLEQIDHFIDDVLEADVVLELLSILGGEPTLHPQLSNIVARLYDRLYPHHMKRFQVTTNGILPMPEEIESLPDSYISVSPVVAKDHRCQWVAPKDTGQEMAHCEVPARCGFNFNCFGYTPCGAGGAIIRLFRIPGYQQTEFPAMGEVSFTGFRQDVCILCQAGAKEPLMVRASKEKRPVSASFKNALEAFRLDPPSYPRIWEDDQGGTDFAAGPKTSGEEPKPLSGPR